jgi:hypothetical protein
VPYAKSINWKCEKLSSGPLENRCSGRGVSAGLKPPFKIIKPHNHTPTPERVEVLKTRDNIKQLATNTNDNPRTIIREAALNLSDACISSLTRQDALRKMIQRTRNTKCGYGFQFHGLVKSWYCEKFRLSFKKMQALAFLPINDVPKGFEILSQGKYIKKLQMCGNFFLFFEILHCRSSKYF